jgi:hypothetical protein
MRQTNLYAFTRTGKRLHWVCRLDGTTRWAWCGARVDESTLTHVEHGLVCVNCWRSERADRESR